MSRNPLIAVPIILNGVRIRAFLDLGASLSIIGSSALKNSGVKIRTFNGLDTFGVDRQN